MVRLSLSIAFPLPPHNLHTAFAQPSRSLHTACIQTTIVIYRALIPPLRLRGRPSPVICTLSVVLILLPAFLGTDVGAMRLLHLDSAKRLTSTDFSGKTIPPYAILSHTWDGDEFLFEDLVNDPVKVRLVMKRFCSVVNKRLVTIYSTSGSTHVVLTNGISASFQTRSILCFDGIETLQNAMFSSRISRRL